MPFSMINVGLLFFYIHSSFPVTVVRTEQQGFLDLHHSIDAYFFARIVGNI